MSVKDGTERRVSFNTRDEPGDKIDKLTVVMSRLATKDIQEKRPFKPQIYKSRGQHRSYGQGSYQKRLGSKIGDNLWIKGPGRITEVTILEGTLEDIVDEIIEKIMEMKI